MCPAGFPTNLHVVRRQIAKKQFPLNILGTSWKLFLKYSFCHPEKGYCCFHLEISVLLPLREVSLEALNPATWK